MALSPLRHKSVCAPLQLLSSSAIASRGRGGSSNGQELLQTLCEQGQLDMALDALSRMHTPPSTHTYLSLLKACNRFKVLHHAKQVHAHLALHGAQLTGLLGDYLVVTLAKCGAIEDAQLISHALPHRTVFSWTALISAYADCGRGHEALQMHQCMQEEGIEPNHYTFVSLLKACGSISDLKQGKKLHADACSKGFASDFFVGNTLVSMYGKCRAIVEAEDVFCALCRRDIVSWTAMISAYFELGQAEAALMSYRQMQEEHVTPNQATFMIALQACGILAEKEEALDVKGSSTKVTSLEIGRAFHADARRKGHTLDVLVCNTLVSMYTKCGAVAEAEDVLGTLAQPHIVSWNAMLSAYVQQGEGERTLLLYKKMHEEGISPELHTIVFALQACGILAEKEEAVIMEGHPIKAMALEIGEQLHADACRKDSTSDVFVGTALLSMYSKCGTILEAEDVFVALSQHDIVSWNAMLSAYVEQGQGDKALQLYRQMQEEGMSPNQLTWVVSLQACGSFAEKEGLTVEGRPTKVKPLEIVQALHADAWRKGHTSDILVGNTLVSMYGKCGAVMEAQEVFCSLPQHNIVSWTAMLSAYVEREQGDKALRLYRQMQEESVSPNQLTFVAALQACGSLAEMEEDLVVEGLSTKALSLGIGQALHADAHRKGYISDVLVGTTLVSMYGKCGNIVEAESVFSSLSLHFVDPCNAMLSLYVAQGQGENALQLYRQMQKEHVTSNYVTFICMLQACSETGHLGTCNQLHFHIVCVGYDWIPSMAATLIHAYGSCASMVDAQVVFDEIPESQIGSWTACIAGYAGVGNSVATLHMFENLHLAGLKPNGVTLTSVISACSHTGLVVNGIEYFESLSRDYGLIPDLKQYGSMLDLFGRVGDFKRVENILERMPMHPDLSIWLCLLGACRLHGNIGLAKQAYDHAVNLKPKQAAAYVLMSNIYADAWLQCCAAEVKNGRQREWAWDLGIALPEPD